MRQFFTLKTVCLFCMFFMSNAYGQDWPMVNCDKGRTSWAQAETVLDPPLIRKTDYVLGSGIANAVSCCNHILFVSIEDDSTTVAAFDTEIGDELWRFTVPEAVAAVNVTPAANDSLVFCGGQNGLGLHVVDVSIGDEIWFKGIGDLYAKSPVLEGDRLYVVGDSLFCLEIKDGTTIWSYPCERPVTPAVDEEKVYLCGDYKLIAFNKTNGIIDWQMENSQRSYTTILVDEDYVYTCNNDSILALDKESGSTFWSFKIPDGSIPQLVSNAIAVCDSFLCFSIWEDSNEKGNLYTLEKYTGQYLWHFTFDSKGVYSPTIANGIVYCVQWRTKSVNGFDLKTGEQVFYDDSEQYIGQAIVADHTLYVGAYGKIAAFETLNSGVYSTASEPVTSFDCSVNWPNPFNQSTRFRFQLAQSGFLDIAVYNLRGERVKTLASGNFKAGSHVLIWDGTDHNDQVSASGIYVLNIIGKDVIKSVKMVMLK